MKNKLYILIPLLIAVIIPFTAFKHTTANANESDLDNQTFYSIISYGSYYSNVNATYTNNLGNYAFNYDIVGTLQPCNFVKGETNNAYALEYYDYRNLAVERILEERITEPFFERYYDLPLVTQYSFLGTASNRFQTKLEFIESDIVTLELYNVLIPSLSQGINDNINNVLNRIRLDYSGLRGSIFDTYCNIEYYSNNGDFIVKIAII